MSLEALLEANTQALRELAAAIAGAAITKASAPDAPKAAEPAAPAASTPAAPATPPAAEGPTFDAVKKAFLALSTKPEGRSRCEGVLKGFSLAKLSEAKADQYAGILAAIEKAAG